MHSYCIFLILFHCLRCVVSTDKYVNCYYHFFVEKIFENFVCVRRTYSVFRRSNRTRAVPTIVFPETVSRTDSRTDE